MWPKKPQLIQEDKTLQMQRLYILEENQFDLDNIEWVQNKQTNKTEWLQASWEILKYSRFRVSKVTSGQRKEKNIYSVK